MPVRFDNRTLKALSALAGDAGGLNRVSADLSEGELRGEASIPLPLGLWVNASATVRGSHIGFPRYRAKIGHIVVPSVISRQLTRFGRFMLQMAGAEIPPLDDVVQSFSVEQDHVLARLKLPRERKLFDLVVAARSSKVNHDLVNKTLCRIAAAQRAEPVTTLSELVRRTFAGAIPTDAEEYNRAAFVALSLAVLRAKAELLITGAPKPETRCVFPEDVFVLQGRADLAKHWVLSAALTSVLGPEAAKNVGEWKELDDSRPSGSGFSFVDLAADRAGVRTALLAVDAGSALVTAEQLRQATENYLLPKALLKAPEGLTDAAFSARYGSLERKKYREAVSRIDQILAQRSSR